MTTQTEPRTSACRARGARPYAAPSASLVVALLALVVVVPLLAVGRVLQAASTDDRTQTDVIVVLGAAQFWGRPSPVLEARLGQARELLRDGVAPRILTVGGKQDGDITTEAPGGQAVARRRGRGAGQGHRGADRPRHLVEPRGGRRAHGAEGLDVGDDRDRPGARGAQPRDGRALGIDAHGSPSQAGDGSRLTLDYVLRESGGLMWFWLAERRAVDQLVGT